MVIDIKDDAQLAVLIGLGRNVALYYPLIHVIYHDTRLTNIFGTSISEAARRSNPSQSSLPSDAPIEERLLEAAAERERRLAAAVMMKPLVDCTEAAWWC